MAKLASITCSYKIENYKTNKYIPVYNRQDFY